MHPSPSKLFLRHSFILTLCLTALFFLVLSGLPVVTRSVSLETTTEANSTVPNKSHAAALKEFLEPWTSQ